MNRLVFIVCSLFSVQVFALPENIRLEYIQESLELRRNIEISFRTVDQLMALNEKRDLSSLELAQYYDALCKTVAAEAELSEFMKTDIEQAKIILNDDQLDHEKLTAMMKDSLSNKMAQELIGTEHECK